MQNLKAVFVERMREGGRGAYRIYELEGQTLGFRKIYDWLNKLKHTTSHTQEEVRFYLRLRVGAVKKACM